MTNPTRFVCVRLLRGEKRTDHCVSASNLTSTSNNTLKPARHHLMHTTESIMVASTVQIGSILLLSKGKVWYQYDDTELENEN